jgi:predicted MFS family arabinose efflux permease
VPRRIKDRNIWLVNGTILMVGLAYGVVISLLAVFLKGRGYPENDIGSLAVWFALGIVTFSLPAGKVIAALSARGTLIVSIAGYAVTVALFPVVADNFWLAAADRFFDGAFSVGIWVSCETIILSRAGDSHKAFVTTLYAIAIALGYIFGPFCARAIITTWSMPVAFWFASAVAAATALVVWWRLDGDVEHEEQEDERDRAITPMAALAWKIKTSLFGTFAYGYFQASVVLFLPLYLIQAKGIAEEQTILIPGFFAIGMLAFTNLAGRLGDRHGHLLLMRALATLGSITVLAFVLLENYWAMCFAVMLAGATLASISPVSLALQGVIAEPRDYHRSNAVYNAFYAAGMLFGPALSGRIYQAMGGPAMLYHLAAMWVAFVAFTIVFARDDPAARRGLDAEPASAPRT